MEGDGSTGRSHPENGISIHSLRMEGDSDLLYSLSGQTVYFNPLPPYGGRPSTTKPSVVILIFQSTPSVWRETRPCISYNWIFCISIHSLRMEGDLNFPETFLDFFHFNPLPPYGGRHRWNIRNSTRESISIHSLRMEGDPRFSDPAKFHVLFQSTPSVWRETKELSGVQIFFCYFNPLPPYGGRPIPATARQNNQSFQSTPSVWRETMIPLARFRDGVISIHSLRMEGDLFPNRSVV